jgi:[amino group carrier protein]-L-2-aminoadipate/L-glutamate 6-kinase
MTLILKIGGAHGIDIQPLCDDLVGRKDMVLVHGGSAATNALATALGHPPQFVTSPSGHQSRNTDRRTLEIFAQATALQNRLLVEALQARGIPAIGLSGIDGGLLQAKRKSAIRVREKGRTRILRDQWTGRPTEVNTKLLRLLLQQGYLPVIAPIALSGAGEMLNVDGDRAAAAIAAALQAEHLIILSNVPGLLAQVDAPDSLIAEIPFEQMENAYQFAQGRMRKKVLGAEEALRGGVHQVTLASALVAQPLTSALRGQGTVFHRPLAVGAAQ